MSMPPPYRNTLAIGSHFKGIPYGPVKHDDGHENYGFKLLKGRADLIDTIPELQKDPDLRNLVAQINSRETGLLTVGCLSEPIQDENGFRKTGYVEFALNSRSAIADAANYFPIFFHFARALQENKFEHRMGYDWELEPATFRQCESATGYTCTIYLNSWFASDSEASTRIWSASLGSLAQYLSGVSQTHDDPLYSNGG